MSTKIKRISVKNLKALSEKDITFNGCTAIVTAGNNKGKTSFLRSLMDRMQSIKPDRILKQGEKDGFYEMELTTGEKFVWKFNDTTSAGIKEKLTFITEKNIPTSLTKDISKYYFPSVFDVDKFLSDPPAKQKLALEKIVGIDFTDINRLITAAEEDRSYQSRLSEEEKARLLTVFTNLPIVIDISFEAIEKEIQTAGLKNEQIKSFIFRLDSKKQILQSNKAEIVTLKAKIAFLEESNMQLETDIDKGDNILKDEKMKPVTPEKISLLSQQVEKIKKSNKEIEENNKAIIQQKKYETAVLNHDNAKAEVERLRNEKLDAIKNCSSLPKGFSFTDEGVTYEGFPFDRQTLSASKIYIAALKLAAIGLGEVKTLYFDASLLDKKSLLEIEKWAQSEKLQLLIEKPDFEGGEIEYQIVEEIK